MLGTATMNSPTRLQAMPRWKSRGRAGRARDKDHSASRTSAPGPFFKDRLDGIFCGGFAAIALGPEDRFAIIFEIGDKFAGLVLLDLEIMGHAILHRSGHAGGGTAISMVIPSLRRAT